MWFSYKFADAIQINTHFTKQHSCKSTGRQWKIFALVLLLFLFCVCALLLMKAKLNHRLYWRDNWVVRLIVIIVCSFLSSFFSFLTYYYYYYNSDCDCFIWFAVWFILEKEKNRICAHSVRYMCMICIRRLPEHEMKSMIISWNIKGKEAGFQQIHGKIPNKIENLIEAIEEERKKNASLAPPYTYHVMNVIVRTMKIVECRMAKAFRRGYEFQKFHKWK